MTTAILHGCTAQPQTLAQALAFDTLTGVKATIVQMDWSMQEAVLADGSPRYTPWPLSFADALWKQGQIYLHSWAAWDWKRVNPPWTAADIVGGKYDTFWHQQAKAIAAWRHPFFVRFNHEFNGSWAPWAMSPADFVAVWRYIVTLFRRDGATNITWVWCPSELDPAGASSSLAADKVSAYYPGSEFVDWLAIDAFNLGNAGGTPYWRTFAQTLDLSYATIAALDLRLPIMLAEFACHPSGGPSGTAKDRASWITDALGSVALRYPRIAAICWYQLVDGPKLWPLLAADGSAAAYAAAIKAGPYAQVGAMPMPPDLAPMGALQSASWADPTAPFRAQAAVDAASIAGLGQRLQAAQAAALAAQADAAAAAAATQADAAAAKALIQAALDAGRQHIRDVIAFGEEPTT